MRKRRFWAVTFQVIAAAVAMWLLRAVLARSGARPSIWLESALAFALTKAAGDTTVILLFRDTVVLFFEDLIWEMVAFIVLGLVAAALILLAARLIGGWVAPFFPALVVYLVYLLAENRQRTGMNRG